MSNGFGAVGSVRSDEGDALIVSTWWTSSNDGVMLEVVDADVDSEAVPHAVALSNEQARQLATFLTGAAEDDVS